MSESSEYIPEKEAYICVEPECGLIRRGPGACACGCNQVVPLARILDHEELALPPHVRAAHPKGQGEAVERLTDFLAALRRVMEKSARSRRQRMVAGNFECIPAMQGACKERLNCLDGGPKNCPMGCVPKEAA